MRNCCSTDNTIATPCPHCSQIGPVGGAAPVLAQRPDRVAIDGTSATIKAPVL